MSGTPNDPNQPRPWGAPPPEPNPYAAPHMPDALGAAPPPPPPPPAYGAAPQYAARPQYPSPAGYPPMPGYGLPPPPPPPPGMGMPDFGIPKPHSGKATASLVCAGVGLVGGAMCFLPALAIPVGLVLGFMGIAETGANGTRSGRGIAIAGTITNALLLVAAIAMVILLVGIARHGSQVRDSQFAARSDQDFAVIRARLKDYYNKNHRSLGPGGPVLSSRYDSYGTYRTNSPKTAHKVAGDLTIADLCSESDLSLSLSQYHLTVTGGSSATVRAYGWGSNKNRVMKVFDVSLDQYVIDDE